MPRHQVTTGADEFLDHTGEYTERTLIEAFRELDDSVGELRDKTQELCRRRRSKRIDLLVRLLGTAICFFLPAGVATIAGAVVGGSAVLEGLRAFGKDEDSVADNPAYFAYLLCEQRERDRNAKDQ